MAYKFQRGNAILSGALEQEGNITIDGGKLTASAGNWTYADDATGTYRDSDGTDQAYSYSLKDLKKLL